MSGGLTAGGGNFFEVKQLLCNQILDNTLTTNQLEEQMTSPFHGMPNLALALNEYRKL